MFKFSFIRSVKSSIQEDHRLVFNLLGAGAAAPTLSTAANKAIAANSSITRSGAGLYAIVFASCGKTLLKCNVNIRTASATPANQFVVTHNWTASTKTLDLRVNDLATPSAADVALNDVIEVEMIFTESATP